MLTTEELSFVTPADWVLGPPQGSWTYKDYAALPEDGRHYEIVNGVLMMAPAPTPDHQDIVAMIVHYLVSQVKLAKLGRVFPGPIDVVLEPKNVFQPDVVVILNAHFDRVAKKKIIGAPDLVVEIASPATAAIDRTAKYEKYARAGVPEYWIVNPPRQTIEVFVLEDGEYHSLGVFEGKNLLPSQVVPGLPVHVEQFFM